MVKYSNYLNQLSQQDEYQKLNEKLNKEIDEQIQRIIETLNKKIEKITANENSIIELSKNQTELNEKLNQLKQTEELYQKWLELNDQIRDLKNNLSTNQLKLKQIQSEEQAQKEKMDNKNKTETESIDLKNKISDLEIIIQNLTADLSTRQKFEEFDKRFLNLINNLNYLSRIKKNWKDQKEKLTLRISGQFSKSKTFR